MSNHRPCHHSHPIATTVAPAAAAPATAATAAAKVAPTASAAAAAAAAAATAVFAAAATVTVAADDVPDWCLAVAAAAAAVAATAAATVSAAAVVDVAYRLWQQLLFNHNRRRVRHRRPGLLWQQRAVHDACAASALRNCHLFLHPLRI